MSEDTVEDTPVRRVHRLGGRSAIGERLVSEVKDLPGVVHGKGWARGFRC